MTRTKTMRSRQKVVASLDDGLGRRRVEVSVSLRAPTSSRRSRMIPVVRSQARMAAGPS